MAEKGIAWLLALSASISFIAGYFIAVIAGIFWPDNEAILSILVIMGLLVGLFNITGREVLPYLVAAIALVLIGTAQPFDPLRTVNDGLVDNINDVVMLLAIFTAPGALIQAIRAGIFLTSPGDYTNR